LKKLEKSCWLLLGYEKLKSLKKGCHEGIVFAGFAAEP
jgi:hypothetical protein